MRKKKKVIPGFGLSFGIVMAILGLIVIIPLCSLVVFSAQLSFHGFIATITRPRVLASYRVSILTAFIASVINAVMGLAIAWVLVRYNFPGKRIMDGIIELPFALPTAVAGIALTHLTVPEGWVGSIFAKAGIKIAYTRIGITVALVFIGIPFVVRSGTVRCLPCPDLFPGDSAGDCTVADRRIYDGVCKEHRRVWQRRIYRG
jgi:sulfate transport system permease protein